MCGSVGLFGDRLNERLTKRLLWSALVARRRRERDDFLKHD